MHKNMNHNGEVSWHQYSTVMRKRLVCVCVYGVCCVCVWYVCLVYVVMYCVQDMCCSCTVWMWVCSPFALTPQWTQPHSWSGPADTYFELAHFKKDKRVQEPAVAERLVKGVAGSPGEREEGREGKGN